MAVTQRVFSPLSPLAVPLLLLPPHRPPAEYLFKQASAPLDPHKKGWTLHQLCHSALPHLAADGRTAPELPAKSRHQHLASLGRYVRLGEQTSARIAAEADPAARRGAR